MKRQFVCALVFSFGLVTLVHAADRTVSKAGGGGTYQTIMAAVAAPPADPTAGLRAFLDAFDRGHLDLGALRAFTRPVYFALGGRSNPDYYALMASRLAEIFPDFTIETFPERHHFDPPHRKEPERVANSLLALWQRADP